MQRELVMNQRIQAAGEWFLKSGIQSPNGGVARYYHTDRGQNAPISTELTGYAASILFYLYSVSSDQSYLEAATKATSFLANTAWNHNVKAMPFECNEGATYSYFFDTGIIARALITGFQKTQDERLLDVARACADSMARDFAKRPPFSAIIELPTKKMVPPVASRWSRGPGCYQLKSALAWHELSQLTGDQRYLELYGDMLEWAAVDEESFLPQGEPDLTVMDRLHAYCYFLEALLPVAEQAQYAEKLRSGIARVAHFIGKVGSEFLRSDVLAQLLRVRIAAATINVLEFDHEAANREMDALRAFQCNERSLPMAGGFWFGRKHGELLPFVNPASTVFGIQALQMWDERENAVAEPPSLI